MPMVLPLMVPRILAPAARGPQIGGDGAEDGTIDDVIVDVVIHGAGIAGYAGGRADGDALS